MSKTDDKHKAILTKDQIDSGSSLSRMEWEVFFSLIRKIVHGPGEWSEKRRRLAMETAKHLGQDDLAELVSWYME